MEVPAELSTSKWLVQVGLMHCRLDDDQSLSPTLLRCQQPERLPPTLIIQKNGAVLQAHREVGCVMGGGCGRVLIGAGWAPRMLDR